MRINRVRISAVCSSDLEYAALVLAGTLLRSELEALSGRLASDDALAVRMEQVRALRGDRCPRRIAPLHLQRLRVLREGVLHLELDESDLLERVPEHGLLHLSAGDQAVLGHPHRLGGGRVVRG